MSVKVVVIGAGIGVGGYLLFDYLRNRDSTGTGTVPLVTQATDAVRRALPASVGGGGTSLRSTPYPGLQMAPRAVIDGGSGSALLFGIQELARDINGEGSQAIIAGLASCESMSGNLALRCYNCNLFGMHISAAQKASGMPYFISNNEEFIDFYTGQTSQVEGFKACLRYFQGWLERNTPNAIEPMRSGQFEAFETAWAPRWNASLYNADLQNGVAVRSTIRDRYNRCVANHLAG